MPTPQIHDSTTRLPARLEGGRDCRRAAAGDSPGLARIALATLSSNLFKFLGTFVIGLASLPLAWIPPRGNLFFAVARLWSRGCLLTSWARLQTVHEGGIEAGKPYVYMANHASWLDIPALIATLPGQGRFIAKRSLFYIPIFGWHLRAAGFIDVDRRDRRGAVHSFTASMERTRAGNSLVVFPEGVRSRDGALLEFERGGFLLALKGGLPIVPVGIRGAYEVKPRGRRWVRPGPVVVSYGRPIAVEGLRVRDREALTRRVRGEIARLSAPAAGGA